MRVLLVEASFKLIETLSPLLKGAGFLIDHADQGHEVVEMVRRYDYNLILLNAALRDIDGYEVLRRLRSAKIAVPVLMVSSVHKPELAVRAFAIGADDFLTLPLDLAELVARMRAILRRSRGYCEQVLRVGRLELHMESRYVCFDAQPVSLTGKEYEVLQLLVLRKGVVLSRDTFLNHLYGGLKEPELRIIEILICGLRKKLRLAGAGDMIMTSRGHGYILTSEADLPLLSTDAATKSLAAASNSALGPSAA